MRKLKLIVVLCFITIFFSGFWSGKSEQEIKDDNRKERVERLKSSSETLQQLYKYAPEAKKMLLNSYGYATFSNIGLGLLFFSAEGGAGVAYNKETGKYSYMNMATGGVGFGVGAKDFRAIFLFRDKRAYDSFVNNGWEANAQADAAAKYDEKGGAYGGSLSVADGVRLYKLTQNGLALGIAIQGTKYWKDRELNKN